VNARLQAAAAALAASLLGGAAADTVEVEVTGVEGRLADNVRAMLLIARYAESGELSDLNIRSLHALADGQIRRAMKPFGRYEPSITGSLEEAGDGHWVATYDISPGMPVRITGVSITIEGEGADDASLARSRGNLPLARGEVLMHQQYESAKKRLLEAALTRGYRDAAWKRADLAVDPVRREAEITLVLATGPRFRFGELIIDQDVVRDDLVRRYAPFAPGDPYAISELVEYEYRLFDSGYFSAVRLEPLAARGNRVPVRLTADPGARRTWRLRGGYGTDTGPRVGASFTSNRLNARGHRAQASVELSSPSQEFTGRYLQPLERPASDTRSYQFGVRDQELGDTDSSRYLLEIRESRRDGPWNRQRYLRYTDETDLTGNERLDTNLLVPGYTLVRSQSNDVTYPTRGSYLEVDVHGGLDSLLSDTSFLRLYTDVRLVRPIGERSRLLLRGEAGATAVADFRQLPATERFFAGGDRSVRGFGLNELGPTDDEGRVIGGRYLLVGSAEYERRIAGNFGFGVFVDSGNAFEPGEFELEVSAGAGLRWLSPIGMVRIDVAQPLTAPGAGPRLHFTFGPEL
jgi:translocation and assembly module TamA